MDIIFSASIIAAFFAGAVALFAPCCITVLLPAYLASAFREKKNILKMTFIFFLGISVVLIPIGLGAASLAQLFRSIHQEMYVVGGLLMFVLAVLSILGKGLSLFPMKNRLKMDNSGVMHTKSVFLLGIFSGAATSCCAPVLAGVVTLAVISGAFWKGLIVTFVYVFGMTFPLFIAAYFYDKFKIEESRLIKGKLWQINLGEKLIFVHSTNVLAGAIFFLMGAVLLALGLSGDAYWAPDYQVRIGETLNIWSQQLLIKLSSVPESLWGILIVGFFIFLAYRASKSY